MLCQSSELEGLPASYVEMNGDVLAHSDSDLDVNNCEVVLMNKKLGSIIVSISEDALLSSKR
jgi:hypothetical protein